MEREEVPLTSNFRLEREAYQGLMKAHKRGDVTYVRLEGSLSEGRKREANAIFIGADYENFEVKNLYKSLNLVKPDVVVLQVRPDLVLENDFKYVGGAIDEAKYLSQITRPGIDLYPNSKLVTYIQKQLMKQGVVLAKTPLGMTREAFKERVSQVKLYEDYSLGAAFNITHRLTPEIIATTSLWSEQHG